MMGVWLRSIRKEYAIICNGCGKMVTVVAQDMDCAIGHFRQCRWKIGKVDLCPKCQKRKEAGE